ncbi:MULTISPECIES: hypothetical protein [Streptomyces]|uniref:hypothetical protein n=1 Tax=Streptomyces TaxID=1883 RepID=UPI00163CBDFB|nr:MULTISPECIES: hypothetical protein [Streptomyces]MBC2874037.1 hypothetical protein [Streptomyces sp. TYQ1024]UBI39028.1 hypothetical protein K7I03_22935 [Streptomyces mobaraensis]UKW31606.1 hypothetical protein MCU78_22880 [Streptomyces sp. TYQ1024]
MPVVEPRECRAAWYAVTRVGRARVGEFAAAAYPANFHRATADDRTGRHVALFNAHYPLVAFADGQGGFREPPVWASGLGGLGFTLLSAARLSAPLTEADAAALSGAEREQIAYWRPENLGSVLFNRWD